MVSLSDRLRGLLRHGDLWLIFGLFGTILLLILPVPPFLLDLLLTVSIGLSLLTLLVILYLRTPAEFTGFPTLLLFITLYRLALNVASTRLILLDGYAGHIIEAFGNFVVRGNYVVGLVVFCILVLINFIVITKGAGRIAEVAARFTLDAMPGKQMAIDAELNAGLINESEARTRRRAVEEEADFYGAMDGASKFVRGDAIAAILITLINIIGGFAVGIMQKGMTMNEALSRFTMLSIGDGLVSQVPALITSVAAGILVTRATSKADLGRELSRQLLFYPKALTILAVMLGIMAIVPGLPTIPFLTMAVIVGLLSHTIHKSGMPELAAANGAGAAPGMNGKPADAKTPLAGSATAAEAKAADKLETLLTLDTFQIELGYGLVALADGKKGGDLLERVTGVRRQFASDMPDGTFAYTRDGALKVDSSGRVVTNSGYPVQGGFPAVPQGTTKVTITGSGALTYKTSSGETTGQVQLARFINPGGLDAAGHNLFKETKASGSPELGDPGQNGFGELQQGFLELSNVSVVQEMVNLILAQRAYEVNSKAVQAADEMMQQSNNLQR